MTVRKGEMVTIAIVGPCGAGKSTLAAQLEEAGYWAHQIAQEHSFVPDMWSRLSSPDILIYLDADFETCQRRKHLNWNATDHAEQQRRLQHARENCDIYIDTSGRSSEEVARKALETLQHFTPS